MPFTFFYIFWVLFCYKVGVLNMREFIVGHSLNLIKQNNPDYSDEKIEILEYGLTGLYIFVSKSIVIFSIVYFLGIFKELLIFMIIYNCLRLVSFGAHATSSVGCLFASTTSFLSATYLCKSIIIPQNIKVILGIMGIVCVYLYSPADTEKRPIISPKRRMIYKTLSTLVAFFMIVFSLTLSNDFLANSCTAGLILQCIMIMPITYKLINQRYDNYKYYTVE